jgi:cellulose synthase/poly-beta-1,6-N-acetylglucosamine synthase-like glycosyltransferase
MAKIKRIEVGIGVFAHNEEQNIEKAITSIQNSKTDLVYLKKIIVVSSGSFDRTNQLVRQKMAHDNRILLLDEAERHGKSAAVNIFLEQATEPVVVTMSADIKLAPRALEEIVRPFLNPDVGMVGAHPIPLQTKKSFIGKEVKLLWELHHRVSLLAPKCGEMVAFRNIIRQISPNSAVDEATIEVLLKMLGYSVVYAPLAVVYNKGPRNIQEFIIQRRRVQAGHQWVFNTYNYKVSTIMPTHLIQVVLTMVIRQPGLLWSLLCLVGMEIIAELLGWVDFYVLGRNPHTWSMIKR